VSVKEKAASAAGTALDALDNKPLMSGRQILLMNVGFFGIQYSFGMQQTAINPIFGYLNADPHDLPILNLAGPITGLLIQPLIGAWSDRTWSERWGRRKPFFLIGAIGCAICLFLFPFVAALWMAVLLLWLLDASNNTAMEPYRAFLADKLPASQLARGFLTQSFFTGLGITLANVSLFVFQKIITGGTEAGIPYWVFGSFFLGAVCSIGSILISVLSTPEIPPSAEELAELRAKPKGLGPFVTDIAEAVKVMPASLHKLGLVYLFQWYAIVIYWQYVSVVVVQSIYGSTQEDKAVYSEAVALTGLLNGFYNVVTFSVAFYLVTLARRYGAKWVHSGCLVLAAVSLIALPNINNAVLAFVPMIGLGIAWASMMGVPYIMVVSMVPKERYGVYMGIINMMIVVPMLIQSVTFGFVYENFLGDSPITAMMFAGVLFLCAAVAMTWIRPPKRQSPVVPLTFRQIMGYDRVIVGSDGSDSAMRGVERAAEVAAASEAGLVVVCAYNPVSGRDEAKMSATVATTRTEVRGSSAAKEALREAVERLNPDRLKSLDRRLVEGAPAEALLAAADNPNTDLIVVGNRGLGAMGESLLGSVPGEVVSQATCDVLIVQTGYGPGAAHLLKE
jgi:maltose/moltooligosaccharide transporter